MFAQSDVVRQFVDVLAWADAPPPAPSAGANAIEHALQSAIACPVHAALRTAAEWFGCRRVTDRVRALMNDGLDLLKKTGRCVVDGDIVKICETR